MDFNSSHPWNKWYAFNIKEELDIPGEYYLDKQERKLYFYFSGRKDGIFVIICFGTAVL